MVKSGEKKTVVSRVCDIYMHTVYDPYKALASLPSPMIASESLSLSRIPGPQSIILSAGLHRQIWVSGSSIFVDIHVVNKSDRSLKKLEIELQKSFLWYDHAAAGTGEKDASHLRIPKRQDSEVVSVTTIKKSKDWKGVLPNASEVRTCQIDVPRGQVTVSTGRFFEVRYFLNIVVPVTILKTVSVQLPVTLIHMNSLDIVPNALSQVAASIEAKRSRTLPLESENVLYLPYYQGQVFLAPQKRSLERWRATTDVPPAKDLEDLKKELDQSPRTHQHHHHHCHSQASDVTNLPGRPSLTSQTDQLSLDPDCYHCHLVHERNHRPSTSHSRSGGKLPRLHVSTSGLGFTDTEFSVQDSPPRKVMLSERERKMINQQRELEKRQEWQKTQQHDSLSQKELAGNQHLVSRPLPSLSVTDRLDDQIKRAEPHVMTKGRLGRKRSRTLEAPSQVRAQPRTSAVLAESSESPAMLRPLNTNLAVPQETRRRANTGPESLSKLAAKAGPDHLHKGVTFPQNPVGLQHMSSKRRGKLPVNNFVFPEEDV